jgi:hypothetical protein
MNIVDRLIVRTIKTLALIPNFDAGQQTKELKPGKKKEAFREEAEKRKQRKRRKGIGDMQSLQIFH